MRESRTYGSVGAPGGLPPGATRLLDVQGEFKTFDRWIWNFVGGSPIMNRWKAMSEIPAETAESKAMSKALKKRGFKFVGPTICYAFMQAVGMVNDHLVSCYRHKELTRR